MQTCSLILYHMKPPNGKLATVFGGLGGAARDLATWPIPRILKMINENKSFFCARISQAREPQSLPVCWRWSSLSFA